jgi:hypothetical protein
MDRSNFTDRAIAANLVTEMFIPGKALDPSGEGKCEKNHIWPTIFSFSLLACTTPAHLKGDAVMRARFPGVSAGAGRAHHAAAFGLLLAQFAAGSASADIATPEQKRACTPDVYRLCAGEIPNARAITACLRRRKAGLSDACRAVFEQ